MYIVSQSELECAIVTFLTLHDKSVNDSNKKIVHFIITKLVN